MKSPVLDENTPLITNIQQPSINTSFVAIPEIKGTAVNNSVKLKNVKEELDSLKAKIESVRQTRSKLYRKYKYAHQFCTGFTTFITAVAMIVTIIDIDENIREWISIVAFICTLGAWGDLNKKATDHLTATNDLQSALEVVNKCTDRIVEIQSDGMISQQEQKQIDNIEEELEKQLEDLSLYSHIVDIFRSAATDTDVKDLYTQINSAVKKCKKNNDAL